MRQPLGLIPRDLAAPSVKKRRVWLTQPMNKLSVAIGSKPSPSVHSVLPPPMSEPASVVVRHAVRDAEMDEPRAPSEGIAFFEKVHAVPRYANRRRRVMAAHSPPCS
jgi:hypothetical protein